VGGRTGRSLRPAESQIRDPKVEAQTKFKPFETTQQGKKRHNKFGLENPSALVS
jgi:hypothetical protein